MSSGSTGQSIIFLHIMTPKHTSFLFFNWDVPFTLIETPKTKQAHTQNLKCKLLLLMVIKYSKSSLVSHIQNCREFETGKEKDWIIRMKMLAPQSWPESTEKCCRVNSLRLMTRSSQHRIKCELKSSSIG